MSTIKTIKLNDSNSLQLSFDPLYIENGEIDLNRLIFIDYMNLSAEIATFSIVYAGVGFLVADLKKEVSKAELELKIFKAKSKKEFREERLLMKKKCTVDEVDDHVRSLPLYKIKNLQHIDYKHRLDTIESLYWSMKSKDDKLQNLSSTISSQDFINDLMNTSVKEINFVRLKKFKPLIQ